MHLHSLENDQEYLNLQTEMVRMQNWLIENRKRLVVICEGRDSAGKGGAIMRFIRYINPRFYKVIALNKPTENEKDQWYFQRYIKHFPNPGEIVFFDRSWYNRAVVEPVMGFCSKEQYDLFLKQVVQFENMLSEDGIILIKFWFSIDQDEQNRRLEERKSNPLINWKLSTVDLQAQLKWDDYTYYKEEMFKFTGTPVSP
jgi:polyphosphate kinase